MSKLACFSCFFLHPWVAHFHPHISSLLMISSRVGLFTFIYFHPDPEFWVEVDIFIHKFHLFWWFHPDPEFWVEVDIFIHKFNLFWWFHPELVVSVDYFSSRPRILTGRGKFHPKISSLLMISSRVGCLCRLFFIQTQNLGMEVEIFIHKFSSLLMISSGVDCVCWFFFIQTHNFEWKWPRS